MAHNVTLSDSTHYLARLVVYRDTTTEGRNRWRLFWENPDRPGSGVDEGSAVTGNPFYRTKAEAIAYGERRYGETATKAIWQ